MYKAKFNGLFSFLFLTSLAEFPSGSHSAPGSKYLAHDLCSDTLIIEAVEVLRPNEDSNLKMLEDHYQRLLERESGNKSFQGLVLTPVSIGLVLNLNAIYDKLSSSGKKKSRSMFWLDTEIKERMLDHKWLTFTASYSGLDSLSLNYYQIYYRPKPNEFLNLSDTERMNYLLYTVKSYKDSSAYIRNHVDMWRVEHVLDN